MAKPSLRLLSLLPLAAAVMSGCSVLGSAQSDSPVQYEAASTRQNLEVPPDLTPIPNDDRYQMPGREGGSVSASDMQNAQDATTTTPDAQSGVLPTSSVVKVMADGDLRWLRVQASPEQLWNIVSDFWSSVGLTLRKQEPKYGFMETNWAENRAKLPQDVIRRTLGKVLDFAYSTGEQDQYRTRLERNADGTTDIFITQRSMIEVVTGSQGGDSSVWERGPSDPMLEAYMLQRLAQTINSVLAPNASDADRQKVDEHIAAQLKPQTSDARATLVKNPQGVAEGIVLREPYDRAWRTVGVLLDRMSFEVVDRDRTAGWYEIRYLDPEYEQKAKDKGSVISNIFSKDSAVEPPHYRIYLQADVDSVDIKVLGPDGQPDTTGVAPKIVALLAEQLR